MNVFCVTTFPSQKNMDSTLTDDTSLVKIITNYISALDFSKKTVVLLHKLIHDYNIKSLATTSH